MNSTESLQAQHDRLDAEIARLKRELAESRALALERALDLEAYHITTQGPEAIEKELARLNGMVRTLTATCDSYRTKCGVVTGMVEAKKRQIAKMEAPR